jgi:hypothetical protein
LSGISALLDEKKRLFSQLPEILTDVARDEMNKYNLSFCKCMYFPSQGFFLVLEMQKLTEQISSSQNTTRSSLFSRPTKTDDYSYLSDASIKTYEKEQFEKLNSHLENSTDLKFEFKAETNFYYKNYKMHELDRHYGDLASIIKDLEFDMVDQVQDKFME